MAALRRALRRAGRQAGRRARAARAALALVAAGVLAAACSPAAHAPLAPALATGAATGPALRLIGSVSIDSGTEVLGTPLGGISGIDYDAALDRYLLISDDRSTHAPARVYTVRLAFDARALPPPQWLASAALRHAGGALFAPPYRPVAGMDVPDAEAVRWLPRAPGHAPQFLWTSEGDFSRGFGPQLRVSALDGAAVRDVALPASFAPAPDSGPRRNGALEGLAISPAGRTAWLAMELPWLQDGPLPSAARAGAPVRITALDLATGQALRQLAYQPDAVHHASVLPGGIATVGVSEVLADGEHHLLVLERSYSMGAGFSARLYRIDTREASNTLDVAALAPGNHDPVAKTLVADFAALGLARVDNLEAMAWGPVLPGGVRTLVFASDDNFNPAQVTQFIAAQYIAPAPDASPASVPATPSATVR